MNSADADRQIEQMIAFIAQEAKEKAEEIQVKTEKEFMADKLSLETQLRSDRQQINTARGVCQRREIEWHGWGPLTTPTQRRSICVHPAPHWIANARLGICHSLFSHPALSRASHLRLASSRPIDHLGYHSTN